VDDADSDEDFILYGAKDIKKIIEKISKNWSSQIKRINVSFLSPMQDKYGNKVEPTGLIKIAWKMDELSKLNWSNADTWAILDLSDGAAVSHPAGRKLAIAFCKDEKNAKYSQKFCRTLVKQ
jgi:hypothetical protein